MPKKDHSEFRQARALTGFAGELNHALLIWNAALDEAKKITAKARDGRKTLAETLAMIDDLKVEVVEEPVVIKS